MNNEITLIKILEARKAIDGLKDMDGMDFDLAYKMARFLESTEKDQTFYNSKLTELFTKYGEKNDSGEFVIHNENKKEFLQKVNELQNISNDEIKAEAVKFPLSKLSNLKVTVSQIRPLIGFIEDEK